MTATSAGVVVPAIIACLVICALILFTCKYCYNPQFLLRQRNPDDIEGSSGSEKPPSRGGFSEVMSASSTANVSGSLDDGVPHAIPVVAVQPDQEDDPTVITVAPNIPPVIEASPPRSRFNLGGII